MHKLLLIEFIKEFTTNTSPIVLVSLSAEEERNLTPQSPHSWPVAKRYPLSLY